MHTRVYHVLSLLTALLAPLPIGTNLGLLHVFWMMLSGRLLSSRGALFPGLAQCGLRDAAVRRAWTALGQGAWTIAPLLLRWQSLVFHAQLWQPRTYGGYTPLAVDVTGFWRPRLQDCPTRHCDATAGKALPAIPLGRVARIGAAGGQRLGLPVAIVRADPADPSPAAHNRVLVRQAVALATPTDVLVVDRGFPLALLQAEQAAAYVVRLAKNFTARRATPPAYGGRGRPPTRGVVVRPLARQRDGRALAATPPDQRAAFTVGGRVIRVEQWTALVLPEGAADAPTFSVWAFSDPRYATPLLVATNLELSAEQVYRIYRDRWPVEQLPLAAKQMIGAERQYVSAVETCQRLPEVAVLAGAILSYAAATQEAQPTGFWDRRPTRTPGRLRRALAQAAFPHDFPLPGRIREKRPLPGTCRRARHAASLRRWRNPSSPRGYRPGHRRIGSPELAETRVEDVDVVIPHGSGSNGRLYFSVSRRNWRTWYGFAIPPARCKFTNSRTSGWAKM